jgi:hypothetical protein
VLLPVCACAAGPAAGVGIGQRIDELDVIIARRPMQR